MFEKYILIRIDKSVMPNISDFGSFFIYNKIHTLYYFQKLIATRPVRLKPAGDKLTHQVLYFTILQILLHTPKNIWLKTLNITLPLFSSLLIVSLFFEIPAGVQLQLMFRISFYLLLSVFLTITIDQVKLVELARRSRKHRLAYQILYLILATIEIAKYLKVRFEQEENNSRNILFVLHNTLTSAFEDLQNFDLKISLQIEKPEIRMNSKPVIADFFLTLLLIIEILPFLGCNEQGCIVV